MGRALRGALSDGVGWLAERRIPRFLRRPIFGTYARLYSVDLDEVRLELADHPSLGAFFVRRLRDGARAFPADAAVLPSPADGRVQAIDPIRDGTVLQAKGRPYGVDELLGGLGAGHDLEGGHAWTIYLSPRDYHRVHAPVDATLRRVAWIAGERFSVAPAVLEKRAKVLSVNERAVLELDAAGTPLWLVMVGALNVGRIRVVGVEPPGRTETTECDRAFARGDELARFEMGSTVVLVSPPGAFEPLAGLEVGQTLRMGEPIGRAAPGA